MLFNSFGFLAFFFAFLPTVYLPPHRSRWLLLAAASLLFYAMFRIEYLALLFAVSGVAYGAALLIVRPTAEVRLKADTTRRAVLAASIAVIIGILATSKLVPGAGFAAAAGLSFYSLSAISYLVDVHRRELSAERHF